MASDSDINSLQQKLSKINQQISKLTRDYSDAVQSYATGGKSPERINRIRDEIDNLKAARDNMHERIVQLQQSKQLEQSNAAMKQSGKMFQREEERVGAPTPQNPSSSSRVGNWFSRKGGELIGQTTNKNGEEEEQSKLAKVTAVAVGASLKAVGVGVKHSKALILIALILILGIPGMVYAYVNTNIALPYKETIRGDVVDFLAYTSNEVSYFFALVNTYT